MADEVISLESAQYTKTEHGKLVFGGGQMKEYVRAVPKIRTGKRETLASTPVNTETLVPEREKIIRTAKHQYAGQPHAARAIEALDWTIKACIKTKSVGRAGTLAMWRWLDELGYAGKTSVDTDHLSAVVGDPSRWMLELTSAIGCNVHYTGHGSSSYIEDDVWLSKGVKAMYQSWSPIDFGFGGKRNASVLDYVAAGALGALKEEIQKEAERFRERIK